MSRHVPHVENDPNATLSLSRRASDLGYRQIVMYIWALLVPLGVLSVSAVITALSHNDPTWLVPGFFATVLLGICACAITLRALVRYVDEAARNRYLRVMLIPELIAADTYRGNTDVLTLDSLSNNDLRQVRKSWRAKGLSAVRLRARRTVLIITGLICATVFAATAGVIIWSAPGVDALAASPLSTGIGASISLLCGAYLVRYCWSVTKNMAGDLAQTHRTISDTHAP